MGSTWWQYQKCFEDLNAYLGQRKHKIAKLGLNWEKPFPCSDTVEGSKKKDIITIITNYRKQSVISLSCTWTFIKSMIQSVFNSPIISPTTNNELAAIIAYTATNLSVK